MKHFLSKSFNENKLSSLRKYVGGRKQIRKLYFKKSKIEVDKCSKIKFKENTKIYNCKSKNIFLNRMTLARKSIFFIALTRKIRV